jgi:hypothetical protein
MSRDQEQEQEQGSCLQTITATPLFPDIKTRREREIEMGRVCFLFSWQEWWQP